MIDEQVLTFTEGPLYLKAFFGSKDCRTFVIVETNII